MIARLRTWAFMAIFYGGSLPFVLATPLLQYCGEAAQHANLRAWLRFHRWVLRWVVGIRCRFEGRPSPGQYLYAAKHHAMLETFELTLELGLPLMVIKQELARIPLWGSAARRYGAIVVDRDASAGALRRMIADAKAARATGRAILIFPEGTRVPEGARPPLKPGFAGLYRALDLPVVPVAVDSGAVWPKGRPKRAGLVTCRFGDPIPPGLPRAEIEARVHAAINLLEPVS